jgi:hypothetical protein
VSKEKNIEQRPEDRKSENSEEEVNKNISQEQTIEQPQTQNMEVHHK